MVQQALFIPAVALTVVATWAALFLEYREVGFSRAVAKGMASAGYLMAALAAGAAGTFYGRLILASLSFCLIGDLLLISRSSGRFMAGLASFLIGQLFYCGAFLTIGARGPVVIAGSAAAVVPALLVFRWLRPHISRAFLVPVALYITAVSAMVVLALGIAGAGVSVLPLVGALAFYLSDLAVARDRFVRPHFQNRLWGLPLYYIGQLLLASSAGFVGG